MANNSDENDELTTLTFNALFPTLFDKVRKYAALSQEIHNTVNTLSMLNESMISDETINLPLLKEKTSINQNKSQYILSKVNELLSQSIKRSDPKFPMVYDEIVKFESLIQRSYDDLASTKQLYFSLIKSVLSRLSLFTTKMLHHESNLMNL